MLVFLTLAIYVLAILAIVGLRLTRLAFSYSWLAAALGAFLAWLSVFFWQMILPQPVLTGNWQSLSFFVVSPALLVDQVAWVYAMSFSTLALAVILMAPAQVTGISPSAWIGTLGLSLLALLAFLADNPLTLVMVWTALDLAELLNTLRLSDKPNLSERAVISFAVRALGTGFALWASALNPGTSGAASFESISPQVGVYLLLAVGLRLGVLPLHLTYRSEPALRRGMGTVLRMAAASSSLVLLARIPAGLALGGWTTVLLGLLMLALVYGGWKFLTVTDPLSARPFWLIGLGALAVIAALRGNLAGSAAWGSAMILFGGLVFLYSAHQRVYTFILSGLGLGLLALPFTLTASAWQGGAPLDWLFWPAALAGQTMLSVGYVVHLWRSAERELAHLPRWAQSAYPLGLAALGIMIILLGLWGWPGALQLGVWWPGVLVSLLTFIALVVLWRLSRASEPLLVRGKSASDESVSRLSFFAETFAESIWWFYRTLRRLVDFISGLLEGDGGLLWTLLVLVLLMILFQQI
jgi:hypothetical protein